MPNQRISELPESGPLYFNDVAFNTFYTDSANGEVSDDWYLMVAKPKISNEKISFSNFHKSVVTDSAYLNGNQTISGQKIFKDKCYITKRANVTSIQDPTSDGNLSGIGFVGTTGLYHNVAAGTGVSSSTGCDVMVFNDAAFEGKLKIQGTIAFSGEFNNESDFSSLDIHVQGDANIQQGISSTGDHSFSNNLNVSGDADFDGSILNADTLYINENILSNNNQSAKFTTDHIQITSGTDNFIDITDNNIKYKQIINVNESNVVNLSDSTPSGMFHVDGTGYVHHSFISLILSPAKPQKKCTGLPSSFQPFSIAGHI